MNIIYKKEPLNKAGLLGRIITVHLYSRSMQGDFMKKRKVKIIAVIVLLVMLAWLMLTPNALMCRFFLAVFKNDFNRCISYMLENNCSIHSNRYESHWYFYDDDYDKIYTTGDEEVDASISRITSTYLFATIDNWDGRVIFSLNRIPYSRNTGYHLQYAPNDDPLEYYGYDIINQSLGNGWYYSFYSHVMSG
ncbi:MAG: hypothetical protein K2F83_05125 [Oscillospiraceae bacterium]|nr:hypothetical protein [Oscillospiraceae bacterium]